MPISVDGVTTAAPSTRPSPDEPDRLFAGAGEARERDEAGIAYQENHGNEQAQSIEDRRGVGDRLRARRRRRYRLRQRGIGISGRRGARPVGGQGVEVGGDQRRGKG